MVLDEVIRLIAEYKGIDEKKLSADSQIRPLVLDSLDAVELLMTLEETFGVELDVEKEIGTIKELSAEIEQQLGGNHETKPERKI